MKVGNAVQEFQGMSYFKFTSTISVLYFEIFAWKLILQLQWVRGEKPLDVVLPSTYIFAM